MRTSAATLLVIFLASESLVPCLAAPICDGASAGCARLVPRGEGSMILAKSGTEVAEVVGTKGRVQTLVEWFNRKLRRTSSRGTSVKLPTSNPGLSTPTLHTPESLSLSGGTKGSHTNSGLGEGPVGMKADGGLQTKPGQGVKSDLNPSLIKENTGIQPPSPGTGSRLSERPAAKDVEGLPSRSSQEVKSAIHGESAIPAKTPIRHAIQGAFSAQHVADALAEVAKTKGALAGMKFLLGALAVGGTVALVGVEIEDQEQQEELDEQQEKLEEQQKEIEALKAGGKGNRGSTKASSSPSQGTVSPVAASIKSLTDSQVEELSRDISTATYSDDDRLTISDGVEALYNRKSITAAQRAALQGALAAGAVVGDEEADEYESQLGWIDGADSDGVVSVEYYDESRRVEKTIKYLDNKALPKYEVVALIQSVEDMQLSPEHEEGLVDAIESAGERFDREEKQRNMARQQRDKAEGLVLYFSTLGVALTSDEKETFSAWIYDLFEKGVISEDGAGTVLDALEDVPEEIDYSNPWYKRSEIPSLD